MTPIHLRAEFWVIEVPSPEHAVIDSGKLITWWANGAIGKGFVVLPPGRWEIVCLSKEVTEKIARDMVERTHAGGFGRSGEEWKNYEGAGICFSPAASFKTLLRSKGLNEQNTLILKKD